MPIPFDQFLRQITGGTAPVPVVPQRPNPMSMVGVGQTASMPPPAQRSGPIANPDRFMWIGDDPLVNPAVLQGQRGDNPTVANAPVQAPVVQTDPVAFIMAQAQRDAERGTPTTPAGGTSRTSPGGDINGTWVTVTYQYEGVQYYILMPEAYAQNLPQGANLVEGGTIVNDPDAVQRAIDAGETDAQRNGTARRGTLFQMPDAIQGVFRTGNQETQAQQQTPDGAYQALWDAATAAEAQNVNYGPSGTEVTEAPINEQGQTRSDVINDLGAQTASFDQLMSNVQRTVNDPNAPTRDVYVGPDEAGDIIVSGIPGMDSQTRTITDTSRYTIPPLTTAQLRQTDPVKANMLEDQGIFEVPGWMMVVQDQNGNLFLRPASETAPQGFTIITYGGASTPTPERDAGGPLDWGRQILDLLEVPQRVGQAAWSAAGPDSDTPNPVGQFLFDQWNNIDDAAENIPGMSFLHDVRDWTMQNVSGPGAAAFTIWIMQNPELARAAREGGYNGFTGERAVWERFQADRNFFQRMMDSIFTDPSMATATGAGGAVRNVAEEVATTPGVGRVVAPVIDEVGRALEVPERIMNEVVDAGTAGLGAFGRLVGNIPTGEGRNISDAFRRTDDTVIRDEVEEVETQLQDLVGQRPVQPAAIAEPPATTPLHDFGDGFTARRVDDGWELVAEDGTVVTRGRWDQIVSTHEARVGIVPESVSVPESPIPTTLSGSQQLPLTPSAVTTPPAPQVIDTPSQSLDEAIGVADTTPPAQTIDEAIGVNEPMPLRQDTEFQASKQGQATAKEVESWPDWLRPQTADERYAGTNRVGFEFDPRPQDVGRALASEMPDKWVAYMKEYGRRLKLKTGYVAKEAARKAEVWPHLESSRFGRIADGRELRSVYETILEAQHYIKEAGPIFHKYFREDAELPDWAWKRWGSGPDAHTAIQTLEANGGVYRKGMPLYEATELAIFHPSPVVRESAYLDIVQRIGLKDDTGKLMWSRQDPLVHSKIRPELKNIFKGSRDDSIQGLRRGYEEIRAEVDRLGGQYPDRLTIDDSLSLSRQINPQEAIPEQAVPGQAIPDQVVPEQQMVDPATVDPLQAGEPGSAIYDQAIDPQGAAAYDQAVAGSMLEDAMQQAATPALGVRATSTIDAMPMPATARELNPPIDANVQGPMPSPRMDDFVGPRDPNAVSTSIRNLVQAREQARSIVPEPTARETYLAGTTEGRIAAQRQNDFRLSEQDLQSFYVRGRAPSASQMEQLGRRFADSDETIIGRWDRYTTEELDGIQGDITDEIIAQAEDRAAIRVLKDFHASILPPDVRKLYDAELVKAKKKTIMDGDQERKLSELEAQIEALEQVGRKGRTGKFWRGYDRLMSAIRKTFLYNWLTGPRYIATQAVGNLITAGVTRHYEIMDDILGAKGIREAWRAARNNGELPVSPMDEVLDGYGLGGRRGLTRGTASVRDQTLENAAEQAAKKGNSLLGKWTVPIADKRIRDMAGAFDTLARESLYARHMDMNLARARETLRQRMMTTSRGVVPEGVDPGDMIDLFDYNWQQLPQRFSASDIRETFGSINQKWADRHARDWQEAITKTDKAARDEVKRVFFTGDERNVDVALKRVLFFHYWMSRAVPLYTESIARNPYYLYQFSNLIEEMRDNDDLSGSRFMRMMESPFGYNVLIRPDAFLATFATMWEDAGYAPDGESVLGRALRNSPIMVNPLIQTGLNIVGAMGDTFAPDPLGANKFIQFAQMAVDNMNAQFGWNLPPTGNIQERTLREVRDFVSGFVDPVVPDWMASHVPYSDEMAWTENQIRSIVAEIALARGMSLDDPIVQQAMIDPESEMYQQALQQYARQNAYMTGLRWLPITAVLYPKSQLAGPVDRTQAIAASRGTAAGDALFNERNTIASATDYSRTLQAQQDEYLNLGSAEERGAYSLYNAIRFGNLEQPLTVGGRTYSPDMVNALPPDQREAAADAWAAEAGVAPLIESIQVQREAYRESHPQYAEFSSWRAQLNDYEGGPTQWWLDASEGNPNAARWYNGLSDEEKADDFVLTSLDAYMEYAGEQMHYWDQLPIDTRTTIPPGPYNPIGDGTSNGSSSTTTSQQEPAGPSAEKINRQIEEYRAAVDQYNYLVSQYFGEPVNIEGMNPMARQAVESNLRDMGITAPRMGGYLYDYMQWAETQRGGDTSISAYLAWWKQMNPETTETPVDPAA